MTRLREVYEAALWTLAILLSAVLLFPGCPRPIPGTGSPPPAKCSGHLLEECGPMALPLVSECLVGTTDVVACILGITRLVGCATYEILVCVVKNQGDAAAAAYQANPKDTRDHWRAQRAQEFITKMHASFTP
jgi:hypothetical protein